MNREQRRAMGKGLDDQQVEVAAITVHFANGQAVQLDKSKVTIVDKDTMRPIFREVLEPIAPGIESARAAVDDALAPNEVTEGKEIASPRDEFANEPDNTAYTVQFDTPEGKMEYVKNGNWSGVRKVES